MQSADTLEPRLASLDGKDFAAMQSLRGSYRFDRFSLHVDRVPKDPYAPPGSGVFRVSVARSDAAFPGACFATSERTLALRDFLARQVHDACRRVCPGRRGTGNSGVIAIAEPGQEILDRSSIYIDEDRIEVRFFIGLPARGRNVDAKLAATMLLDELPAIFEASLFASSVDLDALERHLQTYEDAEYLRAQLASLGLVAFVGDEAALPRRSGIDPRPLDPSCVVPLRSPGSLRVDVELPHAGVVSGMGIPRGVTLIVGGGYHGKSTLLRALELGVYSHVPGDGRHLCVTTPSAVKVRAASGRSISGTDISAFFNNLPTDQDTTFFSTDNASGSTSQAAFIVESIEAGAQLLLMDEDTCAANFMIRDGRMQQLVARDKEPITVFVDCVRQLFDDLGVSTVLVMGGSGDYFDAADCIIQMADFEPLDVTREAHDIAARSAAQRSREGEAHFPAPVSRAPNTHGLDATNQYGHFRISAIDPHHLVFGRTEIDLSDVEQLVERAQVRAVGRAIDYAKRYLDGQRTLRAALALVEEDIRSLGLDVLDTKHVGDLAAFRSFELAAALNRVRGLEVQQVPGEGIDK